MTFTSMYFCLNMSFDDLTMKRFSMNVKPVRERQGAININKIDIKQPKKKKKKKNIFNIITVQILKKDL